MKKFKPTNMQQLMRFIKVVKPLVVKKDPHWHAMVSMNGLGTGCYDRQFHPKADVLHSHVSFSRTYCLNHPIDEDGNTFLDYARLTEHDMTFMSSSKLIASSPMYDFSLSKQVLNYKASLGFVGNSSIAFVTEVSVPDYPGPILQQMNQLVCIGRTTRQPKPLPDWFKEKYSGKGILDRGVIVKPLQKPSATFVDEIKVAWSDTDFYNHTNYASYVRFAMNAVHAGLMDSGKRLGETCKDTNSFLDRSALKGLTKDIVGNGLKSVDIRYIKESLEGQRLDIHIWQEEGQSCVVKCVIESNNVDICHLTLEYFDDVYV